MRVLIRYAKAPGKIYGCLLPQTQKTRRLEGDGFSTGRNGEGDPVFPVLAILTAQPYSMVGRRARHIFNNGLVCSTGFSDALLLTIPNGVFHMWMITR